jgi:HTH-type transcriptional repressor of NAD biosynthesis genes
MTKAFVFGKFYPFHIGHEAMITFALANCDFLSVLVCSSNREIITGEQRKRWIEETFQSVDASKLEVIVYEYLEELLPNTSASSADASKLWADVFKNIYPDFSLVITSEPYGSLVAGFLNISYLNYDLERSIHPVSSTFIKKDLASYWHFLPTAVKKDFSCKVVLLGTESTGKTTLTERLAKHYTSSYVLELARTFIPDSKNFSYDDLLVLSKAHAELILEASSGQHHLVIIDTDVHITKSYSEFALHRALEVSDAIYSMSKADLYIYLCSDVAYIQDGSRLSEDDRNALDCSHRRILEKDNIPFTEVSGNWEERFLESVRCIDELLQKDVLQRVYLKCGN